MNKVAEAVVRFVSSAGVGAVVSNAIASTTPSNAAANVLSRVLVGIGEAVLSSSLSSFAADHVVKEINEFGKKSPVEDAVKKE